jgi:hypothetical protein
MGIWEYGNMGIWESVGGVKRSVIALPHSQFHPHSIPPLDLFHLLDTFLFSKSIEFYYRKKNKRKKNLKVYFK